MEQGIQGDVSECQRLIQLIDDVRSGRVPRFEGTGNAHTLLLSPNRARIENEYAIPPMMGEFSLADLQDALRGWLDLLQNKDSEHTLNIGVR